MATINGTLADDVLIGTNSSDIISGFAGKDVLIGLAGNDVLNGGTGADAMIGGAGNDIYYVDNAGDTVAEAFGEGIDTIRSSISLSLSAAGRFDVENLALAGVLAINGFGNSLNNVIYGNNASNTLAGFAGNDTLFGQGGNDNLLGGVGNDLLNGGTGADLMRGEAGNDVYVVDSAGDTVVELAGGGIDRIISSISLSLNVAGRLEVEDLTLVGGNAINGAGNALDNMIVGNNASNFINGLGGNDRLFGLGGNDVLFGGAGNDLLDGGTGADFMRGQTGNDVYVVDNAGDSVIEAPGQGVDTVRSSINFTLNAAGRFDVENLTLTGGAIAGVGNALNNTITGNNANNTLLGLGGNDLLLGGNGDDTPDRRRRQRRACNGELTAATATTR